jgi:hypothetical protein
MVRSSQRAKIKSPIIYFKRRSPTVRTMHLILYSKQGCHLCEGLEEKLAAVTNIQFNLEIRDIHTRTDWFDRYQYEVPVLCQDCNGAEIPLPRLSPRASVAELERLLQKYLSTNT